MSYITVPGEVQETGADGAILRWSARRNLARSSYAAPGRVRYRPSEGTISENDYVKIHLDDTEEQPEPVAWWALTAERAAVLSVILHLLVVLFLLIAPPPKKREEVPLDQQPDPLGIIQMLSHPPQEGPIPIQFFPAPGAAAKAPGANARPSDADRVAHGGEAKLPKDDVPKAVPLPGIQEMAPGRSGERQPPPPPPRGIAAGEAGAREPAVDTSRQVSGREDYFPPRPTQPPGKPKGLVGVPDSVLAGLTAEQAARAAKSAPGQGGDDGGGWANEGGFVDSGPLSFDTYNYDWGSYAAEMIRKIKRNWEVPSLAHYGMKGKLTIRFFILKDGRVDGAAIIASSGIPPFDNASLQAILRSNPFRPLPADLGKDREGVTVTFLYNIRLEDLPKR